MSAADRPTQYFSQPYIATSSIGTAGLDFGFVANQVVLLNDKACTVYLRFDSTSSAASTGGYPLKAGETLSLQGRMGGVVLATTATSTADTVRVAAWRF